LFILKYLPYFGIQNFFTLNGVVVSQRQTDIKNREIPGVFPIYPELPLLENKRIQKLAYKNNILFKKPISQVLKSNYPILKG